MSSLRPHEASTILGIGQKKLRRLVRDGVLPAGRLPGSAGELRFDPAEIERFRKRLTGIGS